MDWKVLVARTLANMFILGGFVILGVTYLPIVWDEAWYFIRTQKKQAVVLTTIPPTSTKGSIFAKYISSEPISILPVNREFSLVIEKIGVSAPVVKNVSVVSEDEYFQALDSGVAHAVGTALPGQRGNVYIFAHSSLGFFRFSKYATVFNLLKKLENGDKVHVFYANKDYVYQVIGKELVKGWDLRPLTKTVLEPTLTLQTCDPPGTTFNRLVVTSKLISVL